MADKMPKVMVTVTRIDRPDPDAIRAYPSKTMTVSADADTLAGMLADWVRKTALELLDDDVATSIELPETIQLGWCDMEKTRQESV